MSSPETSPQPPLITYPAHYEFKVMGLHEPSFRELVVALFEAALGRVLPPDAVAEHASHQGKYVSVRVTVRLESEAERASVYASLHREKRIVYYL